MAIDPAKPAPRTAPATPAARAAVSRMRPASSTSPRPSSISTLRPSRSAAWMPCVPSWIMLSRLSRQYCSTGKSRV